MSRIGHHIRETIVQEARSQLPHLPQSPLPVSKGPEPLPDSQEEYHVQVDAAIRDLFPRIPNTDRQDIIDHSFTQGRSLIKGEIPVGLCDDITLARRVQLAVLAHIRHAHTRYDDILKKTTWSHARKIVESLCLDTLVRWRGDEESGRDQLDEILREVVIISDTEDESSDESSSEDSSVDGERQAHGRIVTTPGHQYPEEATFPVGIPGGSALIRAPPRHYKTVTAKDAERKRQRGFKRYQAWEDALQRSRMEPLSNHHSPGPGHAPPLGVPVSNAVPATMNAPDFRAPQPHRVEMLLQNQGELSRHFAARDAGRVSLNCPPSGREDYDPAAPQLAPSRSISPPIDRFKDMLVRSIEPSSPGTEPSFVRTVTARHMLRAGSPPRRPHARQYRSRPSSPITSAYQEHPHSGSVTDIPGSVPILVGQRAVRYMPPRAREHVPLPITGSPVTGAEWRDRSGAYVSDPPSPARRLLSNQGQGPVPGQQPTPPPALMQDRGGFFERVVGPVEQRIQQPHDMFRTRRVVSAVDTQRTEDVNCHGHVLNYGEPVRHFSDQQGTRPYHYDSYHGE